MGLRREPQPPTPTVMPSRTSAATCSAVQRLSAIQACTTCFTPECKCDRTRFTMDAGARGDLEFGTIPGLVRIAAERHGDTAAIVDGDVTLSFRELAAAAACAARGLVARGVAPGE